MTDIPDSKKEYSASSIAKELGLNTQDIFQKLLELKYIIRNGETWDLTPVGKNKGGHYKESTYGRFIAWPETIIRDLNGSPVEQESKTITATAIGKQLDISAGRINSIFSELGWITKDLKGWQITDLGKRLGGIQSRDQTSGVPYVRWPEAIVKNRLLVNSVNEAKGETTSQEISHATTAGTETIEFRDKFKAECRAQDGHYVRSKAEVIIDNWLYVSKTVHAYERKLPIEEDLYCDFYIPTGKVYIEYWGSEEEHYLARKAKKLEIYKKYNLKLIQLSDKDVFNIDDVLPKKLLEFGIITE
ncbi:hypothetical protein DGWBC_0386 [Dehalogenimonas sp. WBC-2]|nr:hypothetical protein DGWBC_0386 [Dehalogenimonas sp. WBC-2]